jgi:dTMP kinase
VARARRESDKRVFDRLEAESDDFHERVRQAYHRLAEAEPERFLMVDGQQSAEAISEQIIARVAALLG